MPQEGHFWNQQSATQKMCTAQRQIKYVEERAIASVYCDGNIVIIVIKKPAGCTVELSDSEPECWYSVTKQSPFY